MNDTIIDQSQALNQTGDLKDEGIILPESPLDLKIDDKEILNLVSKKIDACEKYFKDELKLADRRKVNENFWLGKHYNESELEPWQIGYKDNLIWQDLETRISIAAGRLPDIIATPSDDSDLAFDKAKNLEKTLDIRINNDMTQRLIKDGLRHQHIYFTAAVKFRWDKNIGDNGDFVYELCNPLAIGMDYTAKIPHDGFTADNMEIIYEWLEEPVGVIIDKFPGKRDDLMKKFGFKAGTDRQMATKARYLEIWFTYYDKGGNQIEGVCWKYEDIILGKSKNPFYDWKGEDQANSFNEYGMPVVEKAYNNFFEKPRKPYIFFSHQNLGKNPIDDTTPVEQAIPLQRNINKRGRQITEIADNAIPKKAFNGNYITKEQAKRVSNDPSEHIYFDGDNQLDDVRKAVVELRSNPPDPILYNDLIGNRAQVDSKFATHGTTRGESQGESGISKQITREGDLTVSDDIVNIVVERVIYEMANWATQLMKLFYTEQHYIRKMGKDGEMVFLTLSGEEIDENIGIGVKANSVDKQTRRVQAIDLASKQAIDPLTLFEDMDMPNPKERTRRLLSFLMGETDGYARYMAEAGIEFESAKPNAPQGDTGVPATGSPQGMDANQAQTDLQRVLGGEDVQPTDIPSEDYVNTLMQFGQSPDFDNLDPQQQNNFVGYIGKLRSMVDSNLNTAPPSGNSMTMQQG